MVPGKLEAEHFDEGGPGLAYADTEVENRGNSSLRSADHVDIYDVNGITQLGSSRAGEWIEYTFDVEEDDDYLLKARIATNVSGGLINVHINEQQVIHEALINSTGGWTNYQTVTLGEVALEAGTHTMRIFFAKSGSDNRNIADFDFFEFTVTSDEPDEPGSGEDIFPNTAIVWMEARPANNGSHYGINKPIMMALNGKTAGAINMKIIHPWYHPWKSPKSESELRAFVRNAKREGYAGVAVDHEGWLIHMGPELLRWMYEEANAQGIYFISVPKFTMEHHASLKSSMEKKITTTNPHNGEI